MERLSTSNQDSDAQSLRFRNLSRTKPQTSRECQRLCRCSVHTRHWSRSGLASRPCNWPTLMAAGGPGNCEGLCNEEIRLVSSRSGGEHEPLREANRPLRRPSGDVSELWACSYGRPPRRSETCRIPSTRPPTKRFGFESPLP